jgi:hypothetical protein
MTGSLEEFRTLGVMMGCDSSEYEPEISKIGLVPFF